MSHADRYEITDTTEFTEFETVPFCLGCNRISCGEGDACAWCGSLELEQLTMPDISAYFREIVQSWTNSDQDWSDS